MHRKSLVLIAGLLIISSPAWAQRGRMERGNDSMQKAHRVDIIGMGGYAWTVSQDATFGLNPGKIDLKSGGFWEIATDFYAVPYAQLRLLYRRQETTLTFKQGASGVVSELGDMNVEYLHIGGVKGIQKGNVKPYSSLTLGATRYSGSGDDNWKFSILLSLGAKVYLNEKIGLMFAGEMPWTFTDAFLGIGTGGLSIGGSGIVQFDLVAGVMVSL